MQIPLQLIFYFTAHLSFPHDDTEGFGASWSIEAQTTPHLFQWWHRIPPSVLKDTVIVQSFAGTDHTSVNKLACESFHTLRIVWDTRLLKVRPLQVRDRLCPEACTGPPLPAPLLSEARFLCTAQAYVESGHLLSGQMLKKPEQV